MDDKRREFLVKSAAAFGLCAGAAAFLNSCEFFNEKPAKQSGITHVVDVSEEQFLQYDGYAVMKTFEDVNFAIPVIIVRLAEGEFVCFSSLCTHNNCYGDAIALPRPPQRPEIGCTCHGSQFDPYDGGKPVKGPAERALKSFPTEFDSEKNLLTIFF